MSVVVLGSTVLDILSVADHLPRPNETVVAEKASLHPGGKGANQALAASRFDAQVSFISCVGDDVFAIAAQEQLANSTIDLTHLDTITGSTAVALLQSSVGGETQILVAAGVLNDLALTDAAKRTIGQARMLLCQSEVARDAVQAGLQIAHDANVTTVMNFAPAYADWIDLFKFVDWAIFNEVEARDTLAAFGISDVPDEEAAHVLADHVPSNVVVTLGDKGAYGVVEGAHMLVPTKRLDPVDSTGAGDAFCGVLTAALSEGEAPAQALKFASAAGALASQGIGAQEALPPKSAVTEFSQDIPMPEIL